MSTPATPTIEDFLVVYEEIKAFLLQDARDKMEIDEHRVKYLATMMDTTVLGGKYNRGMTVMEIGHKMALAAGVDAEKYKQLVHDCAVCGWIIEFLQAHFLVEDDIMDDSKTRRGKPCWYLHPGVTTQCAINDGMIVLGWCSVIPKHFFQSNPAVKHAVFDILHDADYRTLFGQFYDVTAMRDSAKMDPNVKAETTCEYTEFTLSHYNRIVKYKTAYYTYFAPLALGKAICHEYVPAEVNVEPFSLLVGEYFQIQDDFLDCFGDPEVIKKIGTDIEDQKCSWLAVTFLANATPEQIATFKANYGQHDAEKVAVIKQMYKDMDLVGKFEAFETATVAKVEAELAVLNKVSPAFGEATEALWAKTYKRKH